MITPGIIVYCTYHNFNNYYFTLLYRHMLVCVMYVLLVLSSPFVVPAKNNIINNT